MDVVSLTSTIVKPSVVAPAIAVLAVPDSANSRLIQKWANRWSADFLVGLLVQLINIMCPILHEKFSKRHQHQKKKNGREVK